MPDPGLDARIKFLDESARLLQGTAPGTSAHLMHERNIVAEEYEKPLRKAQLKDICKACGTILIPDITAKIEIIDPRAVMRKRRRNAPQIVASEQRFKTECLACRRVTRTPPQLSQRQEVKKPAKSTVSIESLETPASKDESWSIPARIEIEKPVSVNTNSKKRAKARKRGGLQALLEKSKRTAMRSSGPGLDLMDFMKET